MALTLKLTLIFGLQITTDLFKSITDIDLTVALNAKINEKFVSSLFQGLLCFVKMFLFES